MIKIRLIQKHQTAILQHCVKASGLIVSTNRTLYTSAMLNTIKLLSKVRSYIKKTFNVAKIIKQPYDLQPIIVLIDRNKLFSKKKRFQSLRNMFCFLHPGLLPRGKVFQLQFHWCLVERNCLFCLSNRGYRLQKKKKVKLDFR